MYLKKFSIKAEKSLKLPPNNKSNKSKRKMTPDQQFYDDCVPLIEDHLINGCK